MPNISNTTVVNGSGFSTGGNGGRKLIRLNNGWLYAATKTNTDFYIHQSKDNGATWTQLAKSNPSYTSVQDIALTKVSPTVVGVLVARNNNTLSYFAYNENGTYVDGATVDSAQNEMGNVALEINPSGTELHASWSSKNSMSTNFGLRHAKASLNGSAISTWTAATQLVFSSSTSATYKNPSLIFNSSGQPVIISDSNDGTSSSRIESRRFNGTSWVFSNVLVNSGYNSFNPTGLFVPKSINGLTNGRLWVAWHDKDATDNLKFNIRTAFSDDDGSTWSVPIKQTSGNIYNQTNATLTADKNGKIFLAWDMQEDLNGNTVTGRKSYSGGYWTSDGTYSGDGYYGASSLFDSSLSFQITYPPVIRYMPYGIRFSGDFNVGASVSPFPGNLGNKTSRTLTAYTITPDAGSTVTQIVEKLNGVTLNTYNNPASLSRTFTVPQVNWDGITFWYSHTAEIIVTDSNGAVTTATYTFVKALADDAPLLEGVAATEDAYERISDKRDTIAAQVGLSAGTTFDALYANTQTIKNTLATNLTAKGQSSVGTETLAALVNKVANVATGKKWASGTFSNTGPTQTRTISGLAFVPKLILVFGREISSGGNSTTVNYILGVLGENGSGHKKWITATNMGGYIYDEPTGVSFNVHVPNGTITNGKWFAYE